MRLVKGIVLGTVFLLGGYQSAFAQRKGSSGMNKFWTIVIWILVFVIVTGSAQIAIESLVPSEWVKPSSILAIVLGWWVAELVRKRNVAKG
jgi:branched-subunit amino acid ABC-type transport system permease component